MKTTLILAFLMFLTSCEKEISGDDVRTSISKCEKNDGVQYINIFSDGEGLVQCNNNAMIKINETSKDSIDVESALKKEQLELCLDICTSNDGLKSISYTHECTRSEGHGKGSSCVEYAHKYKCFCNNDMFGKL